jgi:rare lipoprotein A
VTPSLRFTRFDRAVPGRLALLAVVSLVIAGCAHRTTVSTQPPAPVPSSQPVPSGPAPSPPSGAPPAAELQPAVPGEYVEEGVASWYGNPFVGRHTSNGEIYDMREFTAAHRTLPFGAMVRVTNLANGKQTEIRINDRGPFVANRIIDLSQAAAQALEMIGPGTAMVRLELISGPNPDTGFFCVQIGAFRMKDNADHLRLQLATLYSPVSVVGYDTPDGRFYRVRVGHLTTEDAARQLAARIQSDKQIVTFVLRVDQ